MSTPAPRGLKIGTIIDKTLGVIELNTRAVLIYVAAFTAVNVAITYFSLSLTAPLEQVGVGLAKFVVGVAAGYLLLDALVRGTGLRSRADEDVFFPFVVLSVLYTLGVIAGLIAVVLPGLVIMARWIIAQPLLVARGVGPREALGESWERTRGSEFEILAAMFLLLILLIAVVIACSILFEPADLVGIVVSQLASSAMSVLLAAMGVALYGLIVGAAAAESAAR